MYPANFTDLRNTKRFPKEYKARIKYVLLGEESV
jgi:hypothetical protein